MNFSPAEEAAPFPFQPLSPWGALSRCSAGPTPRRPPRGRWRRTCLCVGTSSLWGAGELWNPDAPRAPLTRGGWSLGSCGAGVWPHPCPEPLSGGRVGLGFLLGCGQGQRRAWWGVSRDWGPSVTASCRASSWGGASHRCDLRPPRGGGGAASEQRGQISVAGGPCIWGRVSRQMRGASLRLGGFPSSAGQRAATPAGALGQTSAKKMPTGPSALDLPSDGYLLQRGAGRWGVRYRRQAPGGLGTWTLPCLLAVSLRGALPRLTQLPPAQDPVCITGRARGQPGCLSSDARPQPRHRPADEPKSEPPWALRAPGRGAGAPGGLSGAAGQWGCRGVQCPLWSAARGLV